MSKKTAIIFILVVFLGALGALIYFYFSSTGQLVTKPPTASSSADTYDPFGTRTSQLNPPLATSTVDQPTTNPNDLLPENKLRLISEEPISGFSVVKNTKTQKTDIHYILRANGNIYETYTDSPEIKRLSITTVPKVYESAWLTDGQKLIIRYLREATDSIQTFSVKINPATSTLNEFAGGIDGNHLPENISTLALNPASDKLFYLVTGANGSTGFISKPDGLNKKVIFDSPLVEWLVSWPKEEMITLTTKASATIPGYLYFLNSTTGNFSRVLGNINGLTTKTNKDATAVLYSDSSRGKPQLSLFDLKKGESKLLPWNTLPEKCLWSNVDAKIIYCAVPKTLLAGDYPDAWYQGLISFSDDWWLINTDTGASILVYNFEKESNNSLDIIQPQMDKAGDYLFFMDKTNLTFWSLSLK